MCQEVKHLQNTRCTDASQLQDHILRQANTHDEGRQLPGCLELVRDGRHIFLNYGRVLGIQDAANIIDHILQRSIGWMVCTLGIFVGPHDEIFEKQNGWNISTDLQETVCLLLADWQINITSQLKLNSSYFAFDSSHMWQAFPFTRFRTCRASLAEYAQSVSSCTRLHLNVKQQKKT